MYNPIYKPWEVYMFSHNNWMFIELAVIYGRSILEVGAGSGLGCLAIKSRYPNKLVMALDINFTCCQQMVERFRYWHVDVPVVRCDGFNLPFPDNCLDLCFSVGVLEHYEKEDSIKLLKEQLRVAQLAIVDVPANEQPPESYGDEHIRSSSEWEDIVSSVGIIIHEFYRAEAVFGMVVQRGLD